jgi:hypothetical protein
MKAAAAWWLDTTGTPVPLYSLTPARKEPVLAPLLADILSQRRQWKQPRQKREPLTDDWFAALSSELKRLQSHDGTYFLGVEAAVLDFCRLGLHTGSRLGEYGQSKPGPGNAFARVPNDENAGPWAGMPLAFTRDDFTFYDESLIFRPYRACLHVASLAVYLHLRIRFDKGTENFVLRKFKAHPQTLFSPVDAALSILRCADLLGIPATYPVGAYRPRGGSPGSFCFIRGDDMTQVMRKGCILAYPNPDHYMRRHIHLLHSHSNRITAAVALFNAGESIETIAHRLRWSEESVKYYLRDCFTAVGPLTEQAILGCSLI